MNLSFIFSTESDQNIEANPYFSRISDAINQIKQEAKEYKIQ